LAVRCTVQKFRQSSNVEVKGQGHRVKQTKSVAFIQESSSEAQSSRIYAGEKSLIEKDLTSH